MTKKIRNHIRGTRELGSFATYLSVQRRARVLFNPEDVEVESCLELGVRYVSLLESEAGWADKPFVLRRFPREALADESDLRQNNRVDNGRTSKLNLSQALRRCALRHYFWGE